MSRVARIVESADDIYNSNFSIDFDLVSYGTWWSEGNTAEEILDDLDSTFTGSGYDLVIGFSGDQNFIGQSGAIIGGIAWEYASDPGVRGYSVNYDQLEDSTWKAARHEVAHNYSVPDHSDDIVCINNQRFTYSATDWEATHKQEISSHSSWFGTAVQ